MPIKTWG